MSDRTAFWVTAAYVILGSWKALELWFAFTNRIFAKLPRRLTSSASQEGP